MNSAYDSYYSLGQAKLINIIESRREESPFFTSGKFEDNNSHTTQNMKTYSTKQILQIAMPILISTLMEQLIGMTDTAFLGRVGEVELGASALGGILYISLFMLVIGFSTGAQILMARRNGEAKYPAIGRIFYHGLGFLLVMSAVIILATALWGAQLMQLIINSDAVCEAATTYLNWRIIGYPAAVVCAMFRAFYVATTNTRTLTYNSIIMVGGNIALNYALIFGHWGCPRMGIAGAALASSLASIISAAFFCIYMLKKTDYKKYQLNILPKIKFSILSRILDISVWTMLQNFLSLATWFIFFLGVEHLGESELASSNILRNISGFYFMSIIALGATASTLVSNLLGQGESSSVVPLTYKIVKLCFYTMLPFCLLAAVFPEPILRIFTNSESLITLSVAPLRMILFSYLFSIPAQILLHTVSGTGNTRTALMAEVSTLVVYALFLIIAVFFYKCNLTICWFSEVIYGVGILLYSWSYLKWGNWMKRTI